MPTQKRIYHIFVLFWLAVVLGCAPTVQTFVHMDPVVGYDNYQADRPNEALTLTKNDIKITVGYLNRNKVEGLTSNTESNPFLSENKTFFTIFQVKIENNRTSKIFFKPEECVVLDGLGNQLNARTAETFRNLYPATTRQYYTYSYVFDEYQTNTGYTDDYYKRRIAEEQIIKGGMVYPNVKQEGLLVFDHLSSQASKITLIIPGVVLYDDNNEVTKKVDFSYVFIQEVRLVR